MTREARIFSPLIASWRAQIHETKDDCNDNSV